MTLYPYGYAGGGAGPPIEMAMIKERPTWRNLDEEFARRIEGLMVACKGALGIGQGWRSSTTQLQLFLSRYHVSVDGPISFDEKRWTKNPGVASAAPPGLSYHESTTPEGGALAADMVGLIELLRTRGPDFGLIEFSKVNNEPWHIQPVEIPHSRIHYASAHDWPLTPWGHTIPNQEDDMGAKQIFIGIEGEAGQYVWTQGSLPVAFVNTTQRDLLLPALGLSDVGVTLSREQFNELK